MASRSKDPATEGLSTNWLRRLVAAAVDDYADVPDHLPADLRAEHGLMSLARALRAVHFPREMSEADEARRRLAYDELLVLQLALAIRRHRLTRERTGTAHDLDGPRLAALKGAVPFRLTSDQERAIAEILAVHADPAYFDARTGYFDLAAARPLCYCHGHYYEMGRHIGKFGFSVEKKAHGTRRTKKASTRR